MERSNFCMGRSGFEMTFGWGEVTGGEMTMGQSDRIPYVADRVCRPAIVPTDRARKQVLMV